MAPTTTNTFTLQPWMRDNTTESALKDILAHVNFERGHFRDITEASLQEEIAAERGLQLSESEDEDEDEDAEAEPKAQGKPSTRAELYNAKNEMLANIRAAEQEVLMSLDFVSLLLSKDAPKQAQTTLSPVLKESVPMGSIGTDLWQRMPVDSGREAQDELLATNVRIQGLQHSADSLLAAANRLQDNVRKETEYWSQILSITEEGWNVCRVPGQSSRLGVRFGFSESSPEYSRSGIAALNNTSDGTVILERGLGSKPRALQAVLRKDGNVIGSSRLPEPPNPEETTLEARIRHARDSLYDGELYHEMIRESRALTSFGVGMKGSTIYFESNSTSDKDIQVSLDLVSLEEASGSPIGSVNDKDALAQAIILAARLLLSQAHRGRLKKRSEIPAPLSDKPTDDKPAQPILRPIMSFVMHRSALDRLNKYIETAAKMLEAAKIQFSCNSARIELPERKDSTNLDALVNMLMQPWVSGAELTVSSPNSGDFNFRLKVETTLAHGHFGSTFTLEIPSRAEAYRFDTIDELVAAADAKIAAALAMALGTLLGKGWQCTENEALVIKDAAIDEKVQEIGVSLNSANGVLSLNSLNSLVKQVSWNWDAEQVESDFWDAARDLVSSE